VSRTRTRSAAETERLAAGLARELEPGDVVLISGELGAGKTTFVRGAARALGVRERVLSPTFTLGRRYRGEHGPVSHLDLYRLEGSPDEEPGLLDEYLTPDAIAFVEWPQFGEPEPPRVAARVSIEHAGGDERVVEIVRERRRP
jgi:tRNA threonylcarbamoyladenosine biosynthesis protein TsaE